MLYKAYMGIVKLLKGSGLKNNDTIRRLHNSLQVSLRPKKIKIEGDYLELDKHDAMELGLNKEYEPMTRFLLSGLIQEDWNILEAGSFIGYHSLLFSKLSPKGKKFFFEPMAVTFQLLRNNMERNNLRENFELLPFGLGDKEDTLLLYHCPDHTMSASIHFIPGKHEGSEEIKITTIDKHFNGRIKFDFIKMDVENNELEVIKGAIKTITRDKPLICIEVHMNPYEWHEKSVKALKILQRLGYEFYYVNELSNKWGDLEFNGRYIPETRQEVFNVICSTKCIVP